MAAHDETVSILTSALQREQFPIGEWRRKNSEHGADVRRLPFYDLIPKDPIQQMRWRLMVRERCSYDLEFRHHILAACRSDILFAINTFVYIFEPRPVGRRLPFNTWSDQDNYIVWVQKAMNQGRDIGIEKSRGIGFSYLVLATLLMDWEFSRQSTLGLVSRKMDGVVDDKENPDALIWKLNYMHQQMPEWIRKGPDGAPVLERNITTHKFYHRLNDSTVYGYEATGNTMTGGRKRAIMHDEAAKYPASAAEEAWNSTQHVTNCRIVIGTYFRGITTLFHNIMRVEESSMLKIHAHWSDNPERAKGLYTFRDGKLVILDPSYEFPEGYKFVDVENDRDELGNPPKGQKTRSPWYDAECARPGATQVGIAEELDIDPKTASSQLLEDETLQIARSTCKTPLHRGLLEFREGKYDAAWVESPRGTVRLWSPLNVHRHISGGPFAMGLDISAGTGGHRSSNSAMVVFDITSGEIVLEYYSNRIAPDKLAQLAYATCKWLSAGMGNTWVTVNFENNGAAGIAFWNEFKKFGWGNVYHEPASMAMTGKRTRMVGYYNKDKGYSVLLNFQRAIVSNRAVVRSTMVAEELGQYQFIDGDVVHAGSNFDPDGAAKGNFHGDCAIAASVAWLAVEERMDEQQKTKKFRLPANCLAARALSWMGKSQDNSENIDDWWENPEGDDGENESASASLLKLIEGGGHNPTHEPQPNTLKSTIIKSLGQALSGSP